MAAATSHLFDSTSDSMGLPTVLSLSQRLEVQGPGEDWTGTTDPAKRRKLQNRLHQRAWRRRQAMLRKQASHTKDAHAHAHTHAEPTTLISETVNLDAPNFGTPDSFPHTAWRCLGDVAQTQHSLSHFSNYAYARYLQGSPRTDLLLSLIKYNVFRALMSNDTALGFANLWLLCDATSPFLFSHDALSTALQNSPASLHPTRLQCTVDHHPWIDLLPDPQLRDNILLQGAEYDDEPLCHDIVDNRHGGLSEGLVVWGDPWDVDNWEVGEEFSRKWGFLLQGCWKLFRATNKWREGRGEARLFPDEVCRGVEEIEM